MAVLRQVLFVSFVFSSLILLSKGQTRVPLVRCVIPWEHVSNSGFRVSWTRNQECSNYNVDIVYGYSKRQVQTFTGITTNRVNVESLASNTIYGAIVRCVAPNRPRIRIEAPCRTRTFKGPATTPTTIPTFTGTPPTGNCGPNFFTCDNGACIPRVQWCNGLIECVDSSDETDCPGHCPKIQFNDSGNMSCTISNAPSSVCYFHCQHHDGWRLVGPFYTICQRDRKWSRGIPSCQVAFNLVNIARGTPSTATVLADVNTTVVNTVRVSSLRTPSGQPVDISRVRVRKDGVFPPLLELTILNIPGPGAFQMSIVPVEFSGAEGIPLNFMLAEFGVFDQDVPGSPIHLPSTS